MKKKQLLFIVGGLVIVGITALMFMSNPKECQYVPRSNDGLFAEKGYRGAAAYWYARQADINGEIKAEAVLAAQAQAGMSSKNKAVGATEFTWKEMGPNNMGGRTRALMFDHRNPNTLFAGSVSGGLWKSTTAGQSWGKVNYQGDALSGDITNLFVSCITQASNGDIYFGTGEINGSMKSNYNNFFQSDNQDLAGAGNGIWKSTDGETFTRVASTWTTTDQQLTFRFVNRLAADPNDANLIYAATYKGLLYSTDAGATWNTIAALGINKTKLCMDVKVGSDGTVVAAIDDKTYVAKGGDLTTMSYTVGSPKSDSGRLEFAIAPSDPNYIYCQAAKANGTLKAIYQTKDKGDTWEVIAPGGSQYFQPLGNQGKYDNVIAVFPDDPERIMIGGQSSMHKWSPIAEGNWPVISSGYVSEDSYLYVHADHHAITFHPNYGQGNNSILVGTDGGVYRTMDAGNSFVSLNKNYSTIQFFKIDCDGHDNVIGGAQDNGTLYNDGDGNSSNNFVEVLGGDGGGVALSELDPRVSFATVYYGALRRSQEPGTDMYETGRYFYNRTVLTHYWNNNEANIGDVENYKVAPFVTLFDLWESFNDENSIDSVEWTNAADYVSLDVFDQYEAELNTKYNGNFELDTTHFTTEDGGTTVLSKVTIGAGVTLRIPSAIYARPLFYTTTEAVYPDDVVKVQDTYQAMLAVPLFSQKDDLYRILLTRKPVNFDVLAEDQPWAQITVDGLEHSGWEEYAFRALKFSKDGEHLYFAVVNKLYRASNLSNARTYKQLNYDEDNADYAVEIEEISTFSQPINTIAVDPNDADRVIVTVSGYGIGDHVYFSSNATTSGASFHSKDGSGITRLPDFPVYAAVINVGNGEQVVLGTHYGIYTTENINDINPEWVNQNKNGMPDVMVSDLVQQIHVHSWTSGVRNGGHIYAGTHGRGIFKTDEWAVGIDEAPETTIETAAAAQLKVYPNPVADIASIEYTLTNSSDVAIQVYDLNGRLVKQTNESLNRGTHTLALDVADIEPGTYVVSVRSAISTKSARVVVY